MLSNILESISLSISIKTWLSLKKIELLVFISSLNLLLWSVYMSRSSTIDNLVLNIQLTHSQLGILPLSLLTDLAKLLANMFLIHMSNLLATAIRLESVFANSRIICILSRMVAYIIGLWKSNTFLTMMTLNIVHSVSVPQVNVHTLHKAFTVLDGLLSHLAHI